MRVFYYAPDTNTPSWGIGMLYTHVRLLRANGYEAYVLHEKPRFRPAWLDTDAPRAFRGSKTFQTRTDDLLVVPEIFAAEPEIRSMRGRRIVFVQASSFISAGLKEARDYHELGYEMAIATMPHVRKIVEKHYAVAAPVVPPCVAPYFYVRHERLDRPRKRQVVIIAKEWCRDISIVKQMLRDGSRDLGWQLIELANKPHREVARILRQSAFHVNVNCHESFNATVPEAMAAGCIPICYEAFGGRDFLRNRINAFVFPTHHAYSLVERTLQLMQSYGTLQPELRKLREGSFETALRYAEPNTEKALLAFFETLLRRRVRK